MTRQPHIDYGKNDAQAPGYLWNSTTQELIPILPEDHPDYEQNAQIVNAAWRRWNGERR
jgi:hypothetical protein